jgi:hypothetical protein
MKPWIPALAASVSLTLGLQAGPYSIDWFTFNSGAGTSSGGAYSVSGSLGQPAAGAAMSAGRFSVTGGFWTFVAVQTQGAPWLTIVCTGTNTVLVSWPSASPGYLLQESSDLDLLSWADSAEAVADDGTNRLVLVSPPAGNRYYRLYHP